MGTGPGRTSRQTDVDLIIAADNLHVLNPVVAQALDGLKPEPLQELARRVEQAGANLIDINPGFLPPRRHDRMAFMVEAVQQVTNLRLILDSPDARVLARGLAAANQPPILNACTLEAQKLREILPLAAQHGSDLVLLLLNARSFPAADLEGKIILALELREHALAAGLTDAQLIYDPVLPNLTWPDAWDQLGAVVKAVRLLQGGELWGETARTMAGVSNLRSGLRHTYPMRLEEAALALLAGAGLGLALVDVLQPGLMETVRVIRQMVICF
jgi:5-methyltetrahydrofolate corrinoid/iron sulfur protein methyltransferase